MENIKERLESYLQFKKINKSEFGRRIGVSNAFISSIKKSISPEKLQKIKEVFPDLNIEWLMTGDGDMIVSEFNGNNNAIGKEASVHVNESGIIEKLLNEMEEQRKNSQEQIGRMLSIIKDLTSKIK